jgi:transposase
MRKSGGRRFRPSHCCGRCRLQVLYTVRSERMLMEQLDYNLLFRWFVGLNIDDPIWDAMVFTKNRDRLLRAEVAKTLLAEVLAQARSRGLLSTEHFTVDGAGGHRTQRDLAGLGC